LESYIVVDLTMAGTKAKLTEAVVVKKSLTRM